MTTEIVNLLNRPIMRSRHHDDAKDDDDENRGITLKPWMISLLISFTFAAIAIAVVWGTIGARLDAIDSRLDRLERITDADRERERLRSPANYTSPPLNTFGRP